MTDDVPLDASDPDDWIDCPYCVDEGRPTTELKRKSWERHLEKLHPEVVRANTHGGGQGRSSREEDDSAQVRGNQTKAEESATPAADVADQRLTAVPKFKFNPVQGCECAIFQCRECGTETAVPPTGITDAARTTDTVVVPCSHCGSVMELTAEVVETGSQKRQQTA